MRVVTVVSTPCQIMKETNWKSFVSVSTLYSTLFRLKIMLQNMDNPVTKWQRQKCHKAFQTLFFYSFSGESILYEPLAIDFLSLDLGF